NLLHRFLWSADDFRIGAFFKDESCASVRFGAQGRRLRRVAKSYSGFARRVERYVDPEGDGGMGLAFEVDGIEWSAYAVGFGAPDDFDFVVEILTPKVLDKS